MPLTELRREVAPALQATLQPSLFAVDEPRCNAVSATPVPLDATSSVVFQPQWLDGSQLVFDQLSGALPWRAMERPMYDRIVEVPRLICTLKSEDFAPEHPLRLITTALENALAAKFSSIGANFYRTGTDSVAWHRDSFRRSGRPRTVALVSLGSPRTLAMRRHPQSRAKTAETTGTTAATTHRWRLGHGDLLVMRGRCQHDWEHAVPKERHAGPRISLAFRSL